MRHFLTLIALLVALGLGTAPGAGADGSALTFHTLVPAAAEFLGDTCFHGVYPPVADRTCEEIYVIFYRESEPSTLHDAGWGVDVQHDIFVQHPDAPDTVLLNIYGTLDSPQGSFDEKKFTSAAVRGSVPMSDGSVADVNLTWDMAAAPLQYGGNDSAHSIANGIDRHVATRCLTVNDFAQQQWRSGAPGKITGSIIGTDVESWDRPDGEPFIAGRSHFTFIYVEHGGC